MGGLLNIKEKLLRLQDPGKTHLVWRTFSLILQILFSGLCTHTPPTTPENIRHISYVCIVVIKIPDRTRKWRFVLDHSSIVALVCHGEAALFMVSEACMQTREQRARSKPTAEDNPQRPALSDPLLPTPASDHHLEFPQPSQHSTTSWGTHDQNRNLGHRAHFRFKPYQIKIKSLPVYKFSQ